MRTSTTGRAMHNNNIIWRWPDASFGAVNVSIAVIVIVTGNVKIGLALLSVSLPAAVIGLLPTPKTAYGYFSGYIFWVFLILGSLIVQ